VERRAESLTAKGREFNRKERKGAQRREKREERRERRCRRYSQIFADLLWCECSTGFEPQKTQRSAKSRKRREDTDFTDKEVVGAGDWENLESRMCGSEMSHRKDFLTAKDTKKRKEEQRPE
jgi:hypothetical protein